MKLYKLLLLAAIFVCVHVKAISQPIDSIACKKVEDTLRILEKLLDDVNSDSNYNRAHAVDFFLEISKLPYEGRVTFFGAEFPSKKFYLKCREWYLANKRKLIWDANKNKIFLKE
jgi:hypothetical protein